MSWYNDWFISVVQFLGLHEPPFALLFLVLVSIAITFFSAGMNRILLNVDEIQEITNVLNKHNVEKREALSEKDPKKWIRVKYREPQVQQIQQSLALKRMIPQFIIILPFFIIFATLRDTLGIPIYNATPDRGAILAILPFKAEGLPLIGGWFSEFAFDAGLSVMGFGTAYFLTAVVTSTMITKLLGFNPRAIGGSNNRPF